MLNYALANYLTLLKNWINREEGQDLIEYSLIIVLIIIVAIAGMTDVGGAISAIWGTIVGELGAAAGG